MSVWPNFCPSLIVHYGSEFWPVPLLFTCGSTFAFSAIIKVDVSPHTNYVLYCCAASMKALLIIKQFTHSMGVFFSIIFIEVMIHKFWNIAINATTYL